MQKNTTLKASVLSLSLLTVMSGAAVAPALGTIAVYFDTVPDTMIKLIITIPALFIILTSLLFNGLITKLAPKTLAIIGLVLYIVGGVFAGLVSNIYLLLIFRALLGVGVGLIMPLSTGYISVLFPAEEHAKLMGYASSMNNLGGIIATSVSGILMAINWRFSFGIYLLGLFVLIMILRFLPSVDFHDKKQGSSSVTLGWNNIKAILPYILSLFSIMVIFYALPSNFSMIATTSGVIPTSFIGMIMSIQNIAAFGIGLLLSQFLRTFKKASPYVGALMLLFGFICISFIHVLLLTVIGLIGIGIGLGTIVPIMNAQIARVTERSKAPAAMALMSAFLFLGQFLSPIIIDALVALLPVDSLRAPYYIAALLCGLFTVILIFIPIRVNGENK